MTDPSIEQHLNLIEGEQLIANRFKNTKRINPNGGDGTFSLIFKSYDSVTNKEIVLKFYNPLKIGDIYRFLSFVRESEMLEKLVGQNDVLQIILPKSELTIKTINPVNNIEIPQIILILRLN
jgi:serine/threonine protein kinase